MKPARVAYVDIETAPNLGWVWGKWEQNVIDFKQHWYMLSFAVKWQGERKTRVHALPDFVGAYARNREDDTALVHQLHRVFDEADVIIGHNIDKFDIRKTNARFVALGLPPPSPYQTVDTLKIARRILDTGCGNALDDLGGYLGVGRKLAHTGKHLWFACMNGDRKAWATMCKYNIRDVELLEKVYLKLRPWSKNHPNLAHYTRAHLHDACPVCQHEHSTGKGWRYTATGRRQRRVCGKCGHQFSAKFERDPVPG